MKRRNRHIFAWVREDLVKMGVGNQGGRLVIRSVGRDTDGFLDLVRFSATLFPEV